jgi:type IV pilus assembly protein PilY1
VDLFTGSLIWSYSYANNASMTYCIPSDLARVDTDDNGRIDRLYAPTLGGRIWRFDLTDGDPTNWKAKLLFTANPGGTEQRKIFYPPDVTLERDSVGNYEMLFFGTGDREHPKDITVLNRIYAVKDRNPSALLSEPDLVDVTQDQLQDPGTTADQKTAILNALLEKSGWYIKLDVNVGEKVLASPVVFFKKVYYSSFSPSIQTEPDPCFIGQGRGRIYILQYTNGNAAFNLDASNDIGGELIQRSDRTGMIGSAIPSGVIITFIGGQAVSYVGIGGGVYTPQLPTTKSLVPINWRLVF